MYHPLCHSGFGTLDLANLDAGSDLPLMPTYPIKLVCESRPLSAQHPSLTQRDTDDNTNWSWQGGRHIYEPLTVHHFPFTTQLKHTYVLQMNHFDTYSIGILCIQTSFLVSILLLLIMCEFKKWYCLWSAEIKSQRWNSYNIHEDLRRMKSV